MPRTNSRKRNHRNGDTVRSTAPSNLSPNAPEFIPTGKYYTNVVAIIIFRIPKTYFQ